MDDVSKAVISGPNMYSLLITEFERLRPVECKRCRIPLPFWGPVPGSSKGTWFMGTPALCPYNCRQVIAELWAKITTEYFISAPLQRKINVPKLMLPDLAPE